MIPLEQMPEYRRDLVNVPVDFPPLDEEQAVRHVEFVDSLLEYLELEGEADLSAKDLTFLRSAQVGEKRFWIWEFEGDSSDKYYAVASEKPNGSTRLSYDPAEGLTPEQFMLAEYHECY
jgi:hypothetical protein